jgi:hypothetical protein
VLVSRTKHLLWNIPEKGFRQTPPKHRRALFPQQPTPLASGLLPGTPSEIARTFIGFQTSHSFVPMSLNLTFMITYHFLACTGAQLFCWTLGIPIKRSRVLVAHTCNPG